MNIMETRGLSYSYDGKGKALEGVDLCVKSGSVTAILGGNGAGKSTLFLLMNGVLRPKDGDVFYRGQKVSFNARSIREMRKHVGIVFQDPNDQLFSASVRNDIAFGALNLGWEESVVQDRVCEIARRTEVTPFLDKPTHALSYGQKKRVAIAGVLIMEPDVLIMDEPTAGMDPHGVSEFFRLLKQIRSEMDISIIISTHEIDIVPLYCDYAYVLHKGKVTMNGTPEELFCRGTELRSYSLRLPRISHLMEILRDRDGLDVDPSISTISRARDAIKGLIKKNE